MFLIVGQTGRQIRGFCMRSKFSKYKLVDRLGTTENQLHRVTDDNVRG